MKIIRVLQIATGLAIGDQSGGAELVAAQIARLLDRDRFTSAIFVMWNYESPRQQSWLAQLKKDKIPVYGLHQHKDYSISEILTISKGLWQSINEFRPDIICSHSERADSINLLMHLFHPLHPKSVRAIHIDKTWATHRYAGIFLEQMVFPVFFSAEIAISSTIRQILQERAFAQMQKIHLCYNGIDKKNFSRNEKTQNKSTDLENILSKGNSNKPLIGIIGRLTKQKGHVYLFRALSLIPPDERPDILVVGAGPLNDALQVMCKELGIAENVHFIGSRKDILQILSRIDILVSASLWEGFPTVLLEAMSQFVPVIATDISGSRELVADKQTGLLVPPGNSQALATAIQKMLQNPQDRKTMAECAFQYAKQFTIQNTVHCFSRIYQSIMQ